MLDVDWEADRPPEGSIDATWAAASFEPVAITSAAIDDYVEAMAATRPRGDARFCCLRAPESPVIDWFGARNCLADAGFFAQLLTAEPLGSALDLEVPDDADPRFTVESALNLEGILAEQLVYGGSVNYADTIPQQHGAGAEAKRLAGAFADLIVEDRYEEVSVHRTREQWCGFFGERHWNCTIVCVDRRYRWVWVLVATDRGLLEAVPEE